MVRKSHDLRLLCRNDSYHPHPKSTKHTHSFDVNGGGGIVNLLHVNVHSDFPESLKDLN